ncbi:KamA family radical SAM protein [candidate division KSB1 bacterium]|nr:KamA family radical SAM protein [candidate division KSB1 bacterium]RQW05674.1 MAG: KamA family radical SAM protein [candidate division KSB1 bacterium]
MTIAPPKNSDTAKSKKTAASPKVKWVTTKILDDVFTDEVSLFKPHFDVDYDAYLQRLWASNPEIYDILKNAPDIEQARDALYGYLEQSERAIFAVDNDLHILEKATVRDCIRVFKSIIGPINEFRTEFSALDSLWKLAREKRSELSSKISVGFILEFINLFRGVIGKSNIYLENDQVKKGIPEFLKMKGREAATVRMQILDDLGSSVQKYFKKYPSGLEEEVVDWRAENRSKILRYFGGQEEDWHNYRWHLKHVIKSAQPLLDLIELTNEQKEAVDKAVKNKVAFGITPYYLGLMDSKLSIGYDHAIRAQVIPPKEYVDKMVEHQKDRELSFDFMGEHDTSPIDLVTRRYPVIAILKPFNTCAQICVYCQRNWEIERVLEPKALATKSTIDEALAWFDEHKSIGDVLITGGDPLIMNDAQLQRILEILAAKKHIYRIRIGSRTPVVLPMRFTENLVNMLADFHQPPQREIALVTHFEHSYEITRESMHAVQKCRRAGIGVYNQQVYTVENSRRFETAKLRKDLKSIGVDPYYTFNMKGKEETARYMVPIARILQERKEEARLLPGLDRTDEPVFNVPRLGKNHLRAGQDHRLVMILPDGSRVYEFHPWEKNISAIPPYNYVDVPIYDYLEELAARGENIRDYRTIWFYY